MTQIISNYVPIQPLQMVKVLTQLILHVTDLIILMYSCISQEISYLI